MSVEKIKEKLESYTNEVNDFHPFLKNFLGRIPKIKHVEYTHGNREYGADFILILEDEILLRETYVGIVVKSKKIRQSNIDEIERQINEAFRLPKIIFNGQKQVSLDTVWLLTNNTLTSNAKEKIKEYFRNKNLKIIDINALITMVSKHYQEFIDKMKDDIFTIENNHIDSSGKIPKIDKKGKYLGYYENEYREQFFFIGDSDKQKAIIHGGDFGWEEKIEIYLGMTKFDFIFSEPEILWISSCFSTMIQNDFISVYKDFTGILGYPKRIFGVK